MASTFQRVNRIMEHNEHLPDHGLSRLGSFGRGPRPGDGRGPGRPWGGIVEETPALWVTWFVAMAKRLGWQLPLGVTVGGRPLGMTSIPLTYGPRWYWLCPECGRRCEAVYIRGQRAACRKCLRLGYRSQTQRPTSIYAWLDLLFQRDALTGPRYRTDSVPEGLFNALRGDLGAQVAALFENVRLEYGDETTTRTDPGARADAGAMGGPGGAGSGPG